MRNALACAKNTYQTMVSAAISTVFARESAREAHEQWRAALDRFCENLPKLANGMDAAEHELRSFIAVPCPHRLQLHSTNPLE
jgi:transposase-like protein